MLHIICIQLSHDTKWPGRTCTQHNNDENDEKTMDAAGHLTGEGTILYQTCGH